MKIMISGASGFLGSNLKRSLSKKYIVDTVSLTKDFESHILNFAPDVFINCGWGGGSSFSDTQSFKQFDNLEIGKRLFKVLTKFENLTFVGFGSFSEYGDRSRIINENDIEKPTSLYGLNKKMFKDMSLYFCRAKNFSWLWLRPCYIYGPGDCQNRLITKAVEHCVSGKQLKLDSCQSVVDYLYIEDFNSAVDKLISYKTQGVYNLCSGQQYKVKDVVKKIEKLCNNNVVIFEPSEDRKSFPKYICGNNSKLQLATGWQPLISLDEGLQKIIDGFKQKNG